jgi:hypothetical protein
MTTRVLQFPRTKWVPANEDLCDSCADYITRPGQIFYESKPNGIRLCPECHRAVSFGGRIHLRRTVAQ